MYKTLGVYKHKNNVREHFYCIKQIFELHNTKELLEKLQQRPDLDTICAFDYYKMKKNVLEENGLNFYDYHPESKGITIPEL